MTNTLHTLDAMITALVSAGYEVTFTVGFGADKFAAHVEKDGEPDAGCTALGYTARDALAAALPEAVESYLSAMTPADESRTDRAQSADLEDFNDRLNVLEDRHDKFDRVEAALVHVMVELLLKSDPDGELAHHFAKKRAEEKAAAPGIDSEAWTCAGCGAQCIAGRPADDLCRECAGDGK